MSQDFSREFSLLHSRDVEETRGLVSQVFCEHQLQLAQHQHSLDYEHQHMRTASISWSQMRYGAAVHIAPQPLAAFFLIQLPLQGQDVLDCNGQQLHCDSAHGSIHGPGDVLRMNWSADCTKLAIRIERDAMERYASQLLGAPLKQPLRFAPGLDMRTTEGRLWRHSMRQALRGMQQGHHPLLHPLLAAQTEQLLMHSLLVWQPSTLQAQLQPHAPAVLPRHIKLAQDYIQAHLDTPISNETLASLTGVSVRSLLAGFQKYVGCSPMRHVRELRMKKVHEALLDASQPRSVTEVALQWGFAELGRFASDYKKCFGELPSRTLRRAR